MNNQRFVVVKHAAKEQSALYFTENPRKGVLLECSAHQSYTGEQVGLKPFYDTKEAAEEACNAANEFNPSCGYAVCPVIE